MSVTALVGTNATFSCAGTGNYLVWGVDGLALDHVNILDRHILEHTTQLDSGVVQSNLTVPATLVNNGTTVQCAIGVSLSSIPVVSNTANLTVLPGETFTNNDEYVCSSSVHVIIKKYTVHPPLSSLNPVLN